MVNYECEAWGFQRENERGEGGGFLAGVFLRFAENAEVFSEGE